MYAVLVTVKDVDGDEAADVPTILLYGPYRTRDKAEVVRLNLGEQALSAPGGVDVETLIVPLVRHGLEDVLGGYK